MDSPSSAVEYLGYKLRDTSRTTVDEVFEVRSFPKHSCFGINMLPIDQCFWEYLSLPSLLLPPQSEQISSEIHHIDLTSWKYRCGSGHSC
jgi:hypothetical protein